MKEWVIASPDEILQVLQAIKTELFAQKNILLYGEMGVGKTTFTKQLASFLGSQDITSSPTFSIIQAYLISEDKYLYHMDLYRIQSLEELLDIGFEEYLDGENWVVIEWPELAESLIDDNVLRIKIEWISENQRKIILL